MQAGPYFDPPPAAPAARLAASHSLSTASARLEASGRPSAPSPPPLAPARQAGGATSRPRTAALTPAACARLRQEHCTASMMRIRISAMAAAPLPSSSPPAAARRAEGSPCPDGGRGKAAPGKGDRTTLCRKARRADTNTSSPPPACCEWDDKAAPWRGGGPLPAAAVAEARSVSAPPRLATQLQALQVASHRGRGRRDPLPSPPPPFPLPPKPPASPLEVSLPPSFPPCCRI